MRIYDFDKIGMDLMDAVEQANAQSRKTLHMIGNAHIDPVWLWQWQEGFHEVRATFHSALQLIREYDDFVFVSSSAAFYEWIEESDPQMFAEIRQRVAEGRWGIVGGWWIQPDCNIPCGESFVRQGLYGQHYFKEKFGVTARTGYNVDSFGHNAMLPQILHKSRLDSYVFLRPSPHEKGLPARLFWWEADDCSRVLAYRIPYEYCTWGLDLEKHIQRCAAELKEPLNRLMCFYGVGNHGGGPTRENLESIRRLRQAPGSPELVLGTPDRFFGEMETREAPIPVVHDDLQHHARGCYAAHSGVKRWNRQAENLLLAAEKFSSVAAQVTGTSYPAGIDRAWKNVLFNQFHDILAGSSIEAAYEDARNLYGESMAIGARALNHAVQALAWQINIEPEEGMRPLVVFNPHAWPVTQDVEMEIGNLKETDILLDPGDRQIPFQAVRSAAATRGRSRISFLASLPALGYCVYRMAMRPSTPEFAPIHATDTELENERFTLEIDPQTGWIKSLWDKQQQLEVFAGPAARPAVLDDPSDTWGHNVFRFDREEGCFQATSTRLVEHGPVRSVLRVASEYRRSTLVQEFTMYRELDPIFVRVTVDWREQQKALKLRFPLNLNFMRPVYEIPYGSIERFASGDEEPGQSWVDVSGISRDTGAPYGLSILNDGKYSLDVNVRDIGLTMLRSPIYAHHMPVVPDPDGLYTYIDQGVQRFTYVLLPHEGSWEGAGTVRRAAELNQPPVTLAGTYHKGPLPLSDSYIAVDKENIIVTVLKKAEDSDDLVLRCYEAAKMGTQAEISLPPWGRVIRARFGPAEIKTFRIPRDASQPVVETDLLEWTEQDR